MLAPRSRSKEETMAVVLVHQGPSVTKERYQETVRKLTDGKSRVESPSDWPVPGLLVHAAGEGPNGFRVVDVWESEEALQPVRRGPDADPGRGWHRGAAGALRGAHIRFGLIPVRVPQCVRFRCKAPLLVQSGSSGLLPQPGGFEGLVAAGESPSADRFALPIRPDLPDVPAGLDATLLPATGDGQPDSDE